MAVLAISSGNPAAGIDPVEMGRCIGMIEGVARIRAQLRQHEAGEDAVFTIGPYTFRPSSKILLNQKGNKVRLTEKETAILRHLYRAGQRPVSRETLLQEVWGYNSGVATHTLETHIYRLRQKFEKDAATPAILVTEAGGYKLVP
jgi:DNA-binding response OmpR family regulator